MKCNRLITLIKDWYLHVQDETMAPARMVEFMTKHMTTCEECQQDPDVKQEAEKIWEIVLPPSKKPKVRATADSNSEDEEPAEKDDTDSKSEDEDTDDLTDSA